ncbi:hypothetical protein EXN66_Car014146 [Channa argus]|uniref:TNFR-Cys domain-containing protein n=1 Tax=Channa argus TaxID=215402 RepID=A0A6G1Q7D7_CHAAH|nr:hypothetical protein EXN66_Car014146 [Channa argus]
MTFEYSAAGALLCPTCPEGYFVKTNCSVNNNRKLGVQCEECTDCSVLDQDTLVKCSTFANSVCRNRTSITTTTVPLTWASTTGPVPAFKPWTVPLIVIVSVILLVLLTLILLLLACRYQQQKKHLGNKVLSVDQRLLSPCDTP